MPTDTPPRRQTAEARRRIGSVEAHADRLGLSVGQLCKRAKVAYSTWWRWTVAHQDPTLDTVDKLLKVKGK